MQTDIIRIYFFCINKVNIQNQKSYKKIFNIDKKFAKFYNFDPRNFYDQLNSPKVQIWSEVG